MFSTMILTSILLRWCSKQHAAPKPYHFRENTVSRLHLSHTSNNKRINTENKLHLQRFMRTTETESIKPSDDNQYAGSETQHELT